MRRFGLVLALVVMLGACRGAGRDGIFTEDDPPVPTTTATTTAPPSSPADAPSPTADPAATPGSAGETAPPADGMPPPTIDTDVDLGELDDLLAEVEAQLADIAGELSTSEGGTER